MTTPTVTPLHRTQAGAWVHILATTPTRYTIRCVHTGHIGTIPKENVRP
jgi:hypothetical protein